MSFTMPYSKLYILTELSANDVNFILVNRQKLDHSKYIYLCTVTSIFVEIQPNSTNIENNPGIFALSPFYILIYTFYEIMQG